MKSKKGTMFDPVFMVGIVMLGIMMLVVVATRNVGIPTPQTIEEFDMITAMERSKYMINTLDRAEFGEVTEKLLKPTTAELVSNEKGRFVKIGKFSGEVKADIATGSVTSVRIKFVKRQGKPITIQAG